MKYLTSVYSLYLAGFIAVLAASFYLASDYSYRVTRDHAQYEATNVAEYINRELARFQGIPQLLTSNYQIRQALSRAGQDASVSPALSQRLMEIGHSAGADELFVMDHQGNVIAASNYRRRDSFVSSNFAFRPYFSQAVRGADTAYYALGLRSQERGIFFTSPVRVAGKARGVVALKITVKHFEDNTALLTGDPDARLIGYGEDRVIFIANHAPWRLKQLSPAKGLSWQTIQASRRYLDQPQQTLGQQLRHTFFGDPIWQMDDGSGQEALFISARETVRQPALNLAILLPYEPLNSTVITTLVLTTAGYLLLIPAIVFIYRRLAGYRQLLYTERTLRREVRRQTQALEHAQQALVQSAKLATVGQLTASVNHEINQPLSAISTYLVSSRRMLARGKTGPVLENLQIIESLITRTHRIVAQLKQFSRAGSGEIGLTELQTCFDHALLIVSPLLKQKGITLECASLKAQVYADALRLEQVLVNLMSNAADAMTDSPTKALTVSLETEADSCAISIRDTGPGLNLQKIETIFEPFYTTKSNQGSGLGLAISRTLVDSFGGTLTADNHPSGGAVFTLTLKRDTD